MIVASVIFWVILPLRQAETIGFRNFSFFSSLDYNETMLHLVTIVVIVAVDQT